MFDLRGGVRFDNYGGRWGNEREHKRILQAYAVEKTRLEATRACRSVTDADSGRWSHQTDGHAAARGGAGMSRTIKITVNTDGSTSVQTRGFAGSSCREATAFLEKELGVVSDERLTSEFYQSQSEPVRQRESA